MVLRSPPLPLAPPQPVSAAHAHDRRQSRQHPPAPRFLPRHLPYHSSCAHHLRLPLRRGHGVSLLLPHDQPSRSTLVRRHHSHLVPSGPRGMGISIGLPHLAIPL